VTGPVNDPPAEAPQLLDAVTLPCGAEVDPLLEQVTDGRAADLDAHQRECVHCQAAIAEFSALWAPVAEAATRPVPAPAGLTAAVMSQIRVLVRDVRYTLQATNLGVIRIAARIVATLARDAARMVPGVRVALGRSTHSKVAALAEQATLSTIIPTPPWAHWAAPPSSTWPSPSPTESPCTRLPGISSGTSSPLCAMTSVSRPSPSTSPSTTSSPARTSKSAPRPHHARLPAVSSPARAAGVVRVL
jgi:hypothetical protein